MSDHPQPSITISVDATNPGQFFASCGLLELADRLWRGSEGWFDKDGSAFHLAGTGMLPEFLDAIATAELVHANPEDPRSSPVLIGKPFRPLSIDWWQTDQTGARDLKVWAGKMESFGIACAMQHAMRTPRLCSPDLFNIGMVVRAVDDPKKKREPYSFDARRASNAHSRDIGFSPNDLNLTSTAYPAVELLCLIGLQVARPAFTDAVRVYDYFTWDIPLPSNLLVAASTGMLALPGRRRYRFENWFRTGQKKHKAFRSAVLLS